jgi:hypothetical protein
MNYLQGKNLPLEGQVRNYAIEKAYFQIIEATIKLSTSFNSELRTTVQIDHKKNPNATYQVHQFLTPYIYLQLEADEDGQLIISYADNLEAINLIGFYDYSRILLNIFHFTNAAGIEDWLEHFLYSTKVLEEARIKAESNTSDFHTITTAEPLQDEYVLIILLPTHF